MSQVIGRPRTVMKRPAVMKVDSSGMTTTGMMPRTPAGTVHPETQRATKPARNPVARPPRNPAPMVAAIQPPTMPGTRPGRSAIA